MSKTKISLFEGRIKSGQHHMKMLVVSILVLSWTVKGYSQEQPPLDELITMKLPSSVRKSDFVSLKMKKVGKAKSSGVSLNAHRGNLFETSTGVIQINPAKGKPEKDRLVNMEKGLKEMYGWGKQKYFTTEIKSINNFNVLVINFQQYGEDIGRVLFLTVNNNEDIVMSGVMEYEEGTSEQALKDLNEFLKGLTFN